MQKLKPFIKDIGVFLKDHQKKLVTAESCTSGGLAYSLTAIEGCSDWFERGFITYSPESKIECLNVPESLIQKYTLFSEEVATAMAQGALANSRAQVAIAITGLAGPGGALPDKPVGTVCFAWAIDDQLYSERALFLGDRAAVRLQTIEFAIEKLAQLLDV